MLRKISMYHESQGWTWSLSDEADSDPMLLNSMPDVLTQTALPATTNSKTATVALVSVVEPEEATLL
jgi:hypothetical protein